MPNRRTFVATVAASALFPRLALAQQSGDPALTSARPALRVLLGTGTASPLPGGGFTYDGRTFRGTFEYSSDGGVVNLVDLEQYLYAVVPHEMPPSWPPAALQAQAVCARTYVLQRSDPRRGYDVMPSEIDQVYPGVAGETPAGRLAVDATAGRVLRYASGFASIAYSSCCGGHTESNADAWGGVALPYLGGVACPWCAQSPNYRWSADVGLDILAQRFGAAANVGTLQNVRITAADASGRARAFELDGDRGTTVVKGSAFRLGVGARVVRSLLITSLQTDLRGGRIALTGGGLGHGVGLCQWGAHGMAQAGRSVAEILALYFPGTQIGGD